MLAVVDTNVWISALVSRDGAPAQIAEVVGGPFTPVFCDTTLRELRSVCGRPKFVGGGLTPLRYERFELRLRSAGLRLNEPDIVPVCRDPKDDVFIALALAAQAEYLISGDGHLTRDEGGREYLAAANVQVVTVREFVAILDQQA